MKNIFSLSLAIAFVLALATSCRTYELGREQWRAVPTIEKDYAILGTIRLEAKKGNKEATYDGLLVKAREQYGADVDVIGIKMDEYRKGDFTWVIMNCYAIKYKD